MTEELALYGDDTDVVLTPAELEVFKEVDEVIQKMAETRSLAVATRYGRSIYRGVRIRGVSLAKLLWSIRDNWDKLDVHDDYYSVMESDMGVPPTTSHKYVAMWEAVFANPSIPDMVKQRLLCKPIKTLLLLTATASDGNEIDWDEVVRAVSYSEVRDLVRGARGAQTSSESSVFIQINMRSGQLSARKGSNPYIIFGVLNLTTQDEGAQIAIERIIREGRIQEV